MSDLISRKMLKQMFYKDKQTLYTLDDIASIINAVPAAFDLDKVVEKIQAERYVVGVNATINNETTADYIEGFNDMVNIAYAIVKGAVKNEN